MSRRFPQQMFHATRLLGASGVNAGKGSAKIKEPSTHEPLTNENTRPERKKLMKEARKDPELYILFAITAATVGAYGWYQPHFWASVTGETRTSRIDDTEPWKDGAEGSTGKYRYQTRASPGREARVKDAPSALNSVIVPNVNLPRELHEKYNKWGKEGFDEY